MRTMAEALNDASYEDEEDQMLNHNTPLVNYVKEATQHMFKDTQEGPAYNERHIADILSDWQKDTPEDKINPKHYKNVAAGKQYMELMVDMLEEKEGVEAHLFGQVYKYLMRCGNKDEEVQELNKALWYLTALIKFKTEGVVM